MNETTVTQVNITERDGKTVLVFHTDGEGGGITWEYETTNELRNPNGPQPSFCGDSAWWYLSDNSDPWDDVTPRPLTPAWFSPIIIEDHGLVTTHGKSFPADLPLSGQARFWNLAREVAGKAQDVCLVKGFVDTGMTLLRSPFVPDN
ncbi:hypothetical protein NEMBOFW57_010862 [Staphylotrichum longicolle]|uniref:Uncharacterized protein n=1 Tax=Staphylotrichum longicolle TaxID=669026 RepID=A0AAD4ENH2_9PEZI|nr:hypothetical protein NEMBOFW57_010862 [Staphylotrichum longicolle]